MSEELSLAQYWKDIPDADRKERRWLEGPRITAEDLRDGTGPIERVSSAEWFGQWRREGRAAGGPAAKAQSKAQGGALMGFGKYRDRLMADVREDDPGYWRWCLNEIAPFAARARKAGLLDDEDDAA